MVKSDGACLEGTYEVEEEKSVENQQEAKVADGIDKERVKMLHEPN